jgi:hypothetical protein
MASWVKKEQESEEILTTTGDSCGGRGGTPDMFSLEWLSVDSAKNSFVCLVETN